MTIDEALPYLRKGRTASRIGWNGPDQYVALQVSDADSKMTLPYLYIRTVHGDFVPWIASQTDILASDWTVGV
jgi:hypothetical protein